MLHDLSKAKWDEKVENRAKKIFALEISTFIGIDQIPLIRALIYLFVWFCSEKVIPKSGTLQATTETMESIIMGNVWQKAFLFHQNPHESVFK